MTRTEHFPSWRDIIEYGTDGPAHKELIKTDSYKAVLVGLEAGQKIPPHPALAASYHVLEGNGQMVVDGKRIGIEQGATVVVPEGVARGIEAESRMGLLASHASGGQAGPPKMVFRRMAVTGLISMGAMLVLMVVFGRLFGNWSPMLSIMFQGGGAAGLGLWGMMIIPAAALLVMFTMMFFFYRAMSRGGGAMKHSMSQARHLNMMGQSENITLTIPAVTCAHCKATIETSVGELSGVISVSVDIDAKQAEIAYQPPATTTTIEERLAEIGYRPSHS